MINACLRFLLRFLSDMLDVVTACASGLAMRWLLNYSTPQRDWQAFCAMIDNMVHLFVVPDPLADVNIAYLTRVREQVVEGTLGGNTDGQPVLSQDQTPDVPRTERRREGETARSSSEEGGGGEGSPPTAD